jgi:hypothetical protein
MIFNLPSERGLQVHSGNPRAWFRAPSTTQDKPLAQANSPNAVLNFEISNFLSSERIPKLLEY